MMTAFKSEEASKRRRRNTPIHPLRYFWQAAQGLPDTVHHVAVTGADSIDRNKCRAVCERADLPNRVNKD